MEGIIYQTHKLLIDNGKTLAVAESCTGGLASKLLTDLPGSSKYFILGVTAYNNKVKNRLLGIPMQLLRKKGAVSEEVALKLAANVKRLAKADIGIGTTGIAGPSGGSPDKPVGTVYIAAASAKRTVCKKLRLRGSRAAIRKQAALKALELLSKTIRSNICCEL